MLTLVFPNSSHKEAYIDIIQEWKNTPEFLSGETSPHALFRGVDFDEFLSIAEQDLVENAL